MKLSHSFPVFSFELFPPKTAEMETLLWRSIEQLAPLEPDFVSVTYGAGGSTRTRTHMTVQRILATTSLQPAAHLTCVGATRQEIDEVIREYWRIGVRHIVALRGDPPQGAGAPYVPHPDGYAYAVDLIQGIRSIGDFEISVGCYPEGHPASPRLETDIDILKGKADAGATRAITQFVFDWQVLVRFRDTVRQRGLTIPIVPGIMPVGNFRGVTRFAKACGATIPEWLTQRFEGLEGKPDELKRAAVDVACAQIAELRRHGFDKFHFYTLNRAELTEAVVKRIQLSPNQPIQEVQHDTR
jgi:methylenetetrahydrofolate reductase (NADPH)